MLGLLLSLYDVLPVGFAGEAVIGLISLAILTTMVSGFVYVVFATLAPVLVLLKTGEFIAHIDGHFHHMAHS